jgi:hypothetical protein
MCEIWISMEQVQCSWNSYWGQLRHRSSLLSCIIIILYFLLAWLCKLKYWKETRNRDFFRELTVLSWHLRRRLSSVSWDLIRKTVCVCLVYQLWQTRYYILWKLSNIWDFCPESGDGAFFRNLVNHIQKPHGVTSHSSVFEPCEKTLSIVFIVVSIRITSHHSYLTRLLFRYHRPVTLHDPESVGLCLYFYEGCILLFLIFYVIRRFLIFLSSFVPVKKSLGRPASSGYSYWKWKTYFERRVLERLLRNKMYHFGYSCSYRLVLRRTSSFML